MEVLWIIILFFAFIFIVSGIKIINQYERGVVLTLGAYSYTLNPSLKIIFTLPTEVLAGLKNLLKN